MKAHNRFLSRSLAKMNHFEALKYFSKCSLMNGQNMAITYVFIENMSLLLGLDNIKGQTQLCVCEFM